MDSCWIAQTNNKITKLVNYNDVSDKLCCRKEAMLRVCIASIQNVERSCCISYVLLY